MLCIEGSTLKHLCIRLSILNKYAVCRVKKRLISIQDETSKRATNKTKRTQKDKKKEKGTGAAWKDPQRKVARYYVGFTTLTKLENFLITKFRWNVNMT